MNGSNSAPHRGAPIYSVTTALLAGVVFIVTVAAYVILTLEGEDTTELVYLAGPVIGSLFVVGVVGQQLSAKTAPLRDSIEEVRQQTNGVLSNGIRHEVTVALSQAMPAILEAARQGPTPPAPPGPSALGEGPSTATMPPWWPPANTGPTSHTEGQ